MRRKKLCSRRLGKCLIFGWRQKAAIGIKQIRATGNAFLNRTPKNGSKHLGRFLISIRRTLKAPWWRNARVRYHGIIEMQRRNMALNFQRNFITKFSTLLVRPTSLRMPDERPLRGTRPHLTMKRQSYKMCHCKSTMATDSSRSCPCNLRKKN
jgi:hypothetical protein